MPGTRGDVETVSTYPSTGAGASSGARFGRNDFAVFRKIQQS